MGLGALGNSNLIAKTKFRWTFEVQRSCRGQQLNVPASFVKTASRPKIGFEEIDIDYLNAKTWIPGKGAWETIEVTYYDMASQDNLNLWSWLAAVYNFGNPTTLEMGSQRQDYTGIGRLIMYDPCGQPLEQWTLYDVWPSNIDFGDVDMSASEIAMISLTLRYSNAQYQSFCPAFVPTGCCSPCGS